MNKKWRSGFVQERELTSAVCCADMTTYNDLCRLANADYASLFA